jgi:hypothetical protein
MVIGKHRFFSTNLCLLYGCVMKTSADFALSMLSRGGSHSMIPFGLGISFLSMVGTGWTTVALIVCVQLVCDDRDIGMATLILGAVRTVGGSVAITIYSTLLNSVLTKEAGLRVAQAVLPLGFPANGLEPLVLDLINENVAEAGQLPGMTPTILTAARTALSSVWLKGFHHIYIASGAFAAASIIAALISKDVSYNMTDHVAVRLNNERKKENTIEEK